MKTLLFCTSLLNEERIDRHIEWWKYYHSFFPEFDLYIFNDGPVDKEIMNKLKSSISDLGFTEDKLILFDEKLGGLDHLHWGWYRSFTTALKFGKKNFDKIVHIEADALIVSNRLKNYILNNNSGWNCMYSRKYGFGESSIQIINKDNYHKFDNLPEKFHFEFIVESLLPFSKNKNFIGDRYGEDGHLPNYKIDFACQWNWGWHIDDDWKYD